MQNPAKKTALFEWFNGNYGPHKPKGLKGSPIALGCLVMMAFQAFSLASPGGELKQGRYVGTMKWGPSQEKLAVVADFYLEAPEDLTKFPELHASLKFTLGGYNTHEYFTELFNDVRYDFENGILTLDDPKNDTVITAEVTSDEEKSYVVGDVFVRSSAVFGKISLTYDTDEPGRSEPERAVREESFLPLLDGQYEGACEQDRAVIQLQTIRGLKTAWQSETEIGSLSRYYGISARIGFHDSSMCGNLAKGLWCKYYDYGGGSYNFYQGKLTLMGPSATDNCTVQKDILKCEIKRTGLTKTCEFKKVASKIKEPKFFSREFNLNGTPEQLKDLPAASPPKSIALSNAVRGTFAGYLHNETNNTYQYMQLNVMPFSFTENPHNPNQMMISSTATLHLGGTPSGPFITQRYEPRSFYIRPGFTLSGPTTDSFINITEWTQGFIRGVLYSHAFGRVGTVQLIKGIPLPPPADVEMVRSFVGEFGGPIDKNGFSANLRWFRFAFPAQPNDLTDNLIRFSGSYNPVVGVLPVRNIERGTFDPFTGTLGWILQHGSAATFSSGFLSKDNNAQMFWPPAPGVFGTYMDDYTRETFKRK